MIDPMVYARYSVSEGYDAFRVEEKWMKLSEARKLDHPEGRVKVSMNAVLLETLLKGANDAVQGQEG